MEFKKTVLWPVALAFSAGMFFSNAVFADTNKTIKDGIYTDAQAQLGKKVFEQRCSACHVKEFYQAKFASWKGQPLSELYDSMSATMPEDNAGGLMLQEYTDVLAYIFSLLELPSGEVPLDHNDGSMESIIIE